MKAMIADESNTFLKAATGRFRQEAKVSEARSDETVRTYVASRAADFGRQPRSAVEQFIEACPQVDS
jgi:hypothetical protein